MHFILITVALATIIPCLLGAAIDLKGLTQRDELEQFDQLDQLADVAGLPTKAVRCGGNLARAEIHDTSNIKRTAGAAVDHITGNTVVGDQNYPKRYGYRDPHVSLASSCSSTDSLYEFPITTGIWNGVPARTTDIPDRVIIKMNKKKAIYCGLITHTGAPADPNTQNPFTSCTG
ncbi:hypothetical protein EG329_000211 [Mollisiaceae sp. DMI_Dod_QoI]|nr:hypothetical protein EG329_000211 [Helotiales sp. DMI_Dod_QoI]